MSSERLLAGILERGIELWAEGDDLCYQAAEGALTPAVADELREHKTRLVTLLGTTGRHGLTSLDQRRLWLVDQVEPASSAYNVVDACRVRGRLDVAALAAALAEIVRRHEPLRTTFRAVDGRPVQVVAADAAHVLPVVDLGGLGAGERLARARSLLAEEARRPFDLFSGPLLRSLLIRLGAEDQFFLTSLHHIVFDGGSQQVLYGELKSLYGNLSRRRPPSLPELPLRYADFVAWQRRRLSAEILERHLAYWRGQLHGLAPLRLPYDRRPPAVTPRGTAWTFELGEPVTTALKSLSLGAGTSLYMTLLAAFLAILHRYSGQDDVAVGTSTSQRGRHELRGLIGLFVNVLVVRADLAGDPTFGELLGRVRDTCLDAYAHQDLPFEKLVEELAPERGRARNPLFQAFFVLLAEGAAKLDLPGLECAPVALAESASMFDLLLVMTDTGEGLQASLTYRRDLFEPVTVERLGRRFQVLLENVAADPTVSIGDLRLERELAAVPLHLRRGPSRAPLSPHQQRLWFIDRFEAGQVYEASPVYHNLPLVLRFTGPISVRTLEESLRHLLRRHEALRTRIVTAGERVFQEATAEASLDLVDLGGSSLESALAVARRPFDLERDLPIRAVLVRTARDEALLVVALHHLFADRRSLHLLADELSEAYLTLANGGEVRLPDPGPPYREYAVWQRSLPPAVLEPCRFYWEYRLRGELAALALPADRPRPAVQTFTAARRCFALGGELVGRVRRLAADLEAGELSVLLAGWVAVLQRYTGQREIVVGTSDDGRHRPRLARVVGPVANLLVLRHRLPKNPAFRALLRQVDHTVAAARRHSDLPFDELVRRLDPAKDMSRTAFFDVLFDFAPEQPLRHRGPIRWIETNLGYGKYDLHLLVASSLGAFECTAVYNADLFDPSTMEHLCRSYRGVLDVLTRDPGRRLHDFPLAEERHEIDERKVFPPVEDTIHGLFEEQVAKRGENPAVTCGESELSYRELDERANRVAHLLRRRGVGPETLVAVCLERSPDMIAALLGVLKAGGAYLPLDPRLPPGRRRAIAAAAGVRHVLTTGELASGLPGPAAAPVPGTTAGNLAYCLYTSGSTGEPKGVLIEHRNVVGLLRGAPFAFREHDVWTLFHSFSFDFSVWEMYGALLSGGRVVIVPDEIAKEPARLLELLVRERVTVLNQTPSAFYQLLREAGERPPAGLALRTVIFGGEALDPPRLAPWKELFPGVRLFNMYGITETTVHVTWKEVGAAEIAAGRSNVGRPLASASAALRDRRLWPLPPGVPGEICVGGSGVGRGYLGRAALTAERFVPDPGRPGERLYRSGDLARQLPGGDLLFLGRIDDQVQIRGFRVEPGEVRGHLLRHPAVAEAVVVARDGPDGTPRLVAYVVPRPGLRRAALSGYLTEVLPSYMVPAAFVTLEKLPLTPRGKVDRAKLPAPVPPEAPAGFVAPRTPLEEIVAELWEDLLAVRHVGAHDDFFELGGHSLLATQLLSRVRRLLGREVPLRTLFEHPTLDRFTAALAAAQQPAAEAPPIAPAGRDRELPLSFAQQRLYFLAQLEPESPAYNMPAAFRLAGVLDAAALERAFREIARRHETLRTSFPSADGRPRQLIAPEIALAVPVVDLTALPERRRRHEARRLGREESARPFDLERGPLLRTTLLRLAAGEHVLHLSVHHVVSDGWSQGVFYRELATLYSHFSRREPSPLPELTVQYADFAVWQREWLRQEPLLSYWRGRLEGFSPLQLPTDRPRPAVANPRGAARRFELDAGLTAALKEASRDAGASLYMTLLSVFFVLLHRLTGQRSLTVGSPVANRNREEIEGLIGFFVNMLVLRGELPAAQCLVELLHQVRETALAAYAHQDLPFERLVEELVPERDLARHPIFQVTFALQNAPAGELRLPGLRVRAEALAVETVGCDLELHVWEAAPGRLSGVFVYRTELFDATTIGRWSSHLVVLLRAAAADPTRQVAELPLATPAQRHQLLREWNDTAARFPPGELLQQPFEEQAERGGGREALIWELPGGKVESLTYGRLARRAGRLARFLRALGVGAEVRAALFLDRGPDLVVAMLAVLKAGGAYVPVDPTDPRRRIADLFADSRAAVVVTREALVPLLPAVRPETVCLGPGGEPPASGEGRDAPPAPRSGNPAYVLYTSGSTGRPKGAVISHAAIASHMRWMQAALPLAGGDRVLQKTPLTFDASVWEFWAPLQVGARLILARPGAEREPAELVRALREHRVTILQVVPSLLGALLSEPGFAACHSLRRVICGGEALAAELGERFAASGLEAELYNVYGPAEATIHSSFGICPLPPVSPRVAIGRPIANVRIHVVDRGLRPAPAGAAGELVIGGAGLAREILGRPGASAERLVPDPFASGRRLYRTGDLARRLADGRLEFLGRLDHQVKVRGVRVEPGEIESVLRRQPSVREAVVVARPGKGRAPRLVTYVVPEAPGRAAARSLVPRWRSHLAERLPAPLVPSVFLVLDALPVTPSGKVDRRALPDPDGSRPELGTSFVAPRTPSEEALAEIWAEVLGLDRVGVHDNFFELGGHSLLATRLVSRVRRVFGREVPLRTVFARPTLGRFAEALAEQPAAGEASPIRRTARVGELPLSFAQRRFWFLHHRDGGSSALNMSSGFRLVGGLDAAALELALGELVRRHEILRTTFRRGDGGEPRQVIGAAAAKWKLPLLDLMGLAPAARLAEARRVASREAGRSFDLERGPLCRVLLLRLDTGEHVLLLHLHHILSDGWSDRVLRRELAILYEAFSRRRPSPLSELPIQYADFAVWQHERRDGELWRTQLAYWRRRLGGLSRLELATDRPAYGADLLSETGDFLTLELDAALAAAVRRLGLDGGASFYMTLLAAFLVLLHRGTGETDIAVTSPVAQRSREDVEGLVGAFLNFLILRVDLSGDPSFHLLLRRVREVTLAAYAHQDVPLEKVTAELEPGREPAQHSFSRVYLNVISPADGGAPRPAGPPVWELFEFPRPVWSRYDLTLYADGSGGKVLLQMVYKARLFRRQRIGRMLASLRRLLEGAVADPEQRLSRLPLDDGADDRPDGSAPIRSACGAGAPLPAARSGGSPGPGPRR